MVNEDLLYKMSENLDWNSNFLNTSLKTKRNRNNVSVEWKDKSIIKLISAVEVRDLLWNVEHANYKNRIFRDAELQEMPENVFHKEFDASQLSSKWTNLRIQFKSYYAKNNKMKSGQGTETRKVLWKHYDQLMFVGAAEEQQSTLSESSLDLVISESQSDEESTSKSWGKVPNRKRFKLAEVPIDNSKSIASEGMQQALNKMNNVDSFEVFGNFVAEELRRIPNFTVANKTKRKIAHFVLDCMDEVDSELEKL